MSIILDTDIEECVHCGEDVAPGIYSDAWVHADTLDIECANGETEASQI
jgi:hypothetical protein